MKKFDHFLVDIREKLARAEYVLVDPDVFRKLATSALWYVYHGDPQSFMSKLREYVAKYGLVFKFDVSVTGRDRVTFWLEVA